MTENIMLKAAREYALNGWKIIPCKEGSKAPATRNGFKDATSDIETINDYWAHHPNAPIGLVAAENVVIFDIDPRNGGSISSLINILGDLPYTLTCITGRHDGGAHLYYCANPQDIKQFNPHPVKGVDVRTSFNGYVLAPPSLHPEGGRYEWLNAPIASLPSTAVKKLVKPNEKTPKKDSAPSWQTGDITGLDSREQGYATMCYRLAHEIGQGHRNDYLNKCAYIMGKENASTYWQNELYSAALSSGLSEREAQATLASGIKGGSK